MSGHIHQPDDLISGRYRILEFLNEGGMQEVYVAEDQRLKRRVALKVPKTTGAKRRFDRSAHLSARIIHPNVAATLDYLEDGRSYYLVEELISGSDLKVRFDTDFLYMDPHLSAHVFSHLARGLAAAHHAGVWHRDLKPSNIMVSMDPSLDVVKITDFGIAKMAEQELADGIDAWERDESSVTGSKTLVGAIPYMAPERFQADSDVTLPSDIWSLGAILYQLLSGAPPFGRGPAAIAKILGSDPPPPPPLFGKKPGFRTLEDELWGIVQACLSRDPAARPTADALVKSCSKLCYSTAPRKVGVISTYRKGTGDWGFIDFEGRSVFFPTPSFYGAGAREGMRVNFAAHRGAPHPRASPVIPLRD